MGLVKDWTGKDKDKDKDQAYKDHDKDKDQACKGKDKDLNLVLKESLRTRTRINITADFHKNRWKGGTWTKEETIRFW